MFMKSTLESHAACATMHICYTAERNRLMLPNATWKVVLEGLLVMRVRTIAGCAHKHLLPVDVGSAVMLQMLCLFNKVANSFECHQQIIHV